MISSTKVLWLCKLKYMNHEVIRDRYGRLFELPQCLSRQTSVSAFCLGYDLQTLSPVSEDLARTWSQESIPRSGFVGWFFKLCRRAKRFTPECVVASSDCLHIIVGSLVAKLCGARFVADLYDDYSTFGMARIPGMHWLYHRALDKADGISVVSQTLGADIRDRYPGKPVIVLESTIDRDTFTPRDKHESRQQLGLDGLAGAKLVGLCGGLNVPHGADVVFRAFEQMAHSHPEVVLVVAGRLTEECPLPEQDNIRYLGMLPHEAMPQFFSAMDVAIVALANTRFGHYAFPQKAYEIVACQVPVAAADVGALSMLFASVPTVLYDPASTDSLIETLKAQIQAPQLPDMTVPSWDDQARELLDFINGPVLQNGVATGD